MNVAIKPPAPTIASGMGAELKDIYAAKVVDQWLARVFHEEMRLQRGAMNMLDRTKGIGGSPASQKKFSERLRKSLGPMMLKMAVRAGKRANYAIVYDLLHAGAALEDRAEDWDGQTPPKWLHIRRSILRKTGPNSQGESFGFMTASISHHSLVRLVQRGGAENFTDFTTVMKAAHHSLTLIELATRYAREDGDTTALLVPFRMPIGPSDIGCFVVRPSAIPNLSQNSLVATTFLSGVQLRQDQYVAVVELLDYLNELDPAEATNEQFHKLLPLIAQCSSASGAVNA
jgi:hypothetical protein